MDTKEKKKRKNPREGANPINRLFFWWTMKLFYKGAKKTLGLEDLYDPLAGDESEGLGNMLEREWKVELEKTKNSEYILNNDGKKIKVQRPSLARAIFRVFWLKYFYVGLLLLVQALVLRTLQPIFQGYVIKYFNTGDRSELPTRDEALYYAAGLILSTLGVTFIMQHTNLDAQQIGMRVRIACCSLIYRKSLRLSKSAVDQTAAGQVVNLLSNDVNRFDSLPFFLNYIWIMPIQVIVLGYIMWQNVGISAVIGVISLLLLAVPIQGHMSKVSSNLRDKTAKLTDRRVQLMSELIAGIQVVKMYVWEKPFELMVSFTRGREIEVIKKSSHIRGLYLSIMVFTERTTLYLTIISFVLMGNTLTADVSFVLATYFNILQMTTAIFFPQALIMCGETIISLKRLEDFLMLDEMIGINDESSSNGKSPEHKFCGVHSNKKSVTVEFHQVSANWISGNLPPTLCNVSMKISGGKLCALIGPVGSGKSSILNILLRELPLGAGSVKLLQYDDDTFIKNELKRGFIKDNPNISISYASQEAWLFVGTVRDNILFGQSFDQNRYQEVTKVCALLRDFQQLPDGDMTIVGERGAVLSGGQKARINLARAIYRQADLYLLDDPLSAVDTRVGRHLFKNCILKYLRNKTRILVTHQLHFLKQADTIVMMDRGTVKHHGSWNELIKSNKDFKEMLERMNKEDMETKQSQEKKNTISEVTLRNEEIDTTETKRSEVVEKWINFRGSQEISNGTIITESTANGIVDDRKFVSPTVEKLPQSTPDILRRSSSIRSYDSCFSTTDYDEFSPENRNTNCPEESRASGRLSNRVYGSYFRSGGGIFVLTILVLNMIVAQIFSSGCDYWLSYWTNLESVRTNLHNSDIPLSSNAYYSVVNDTILSYFDLLDDEGLFSTINAIYVYTFCIVFCIILVLTRSFLFMKICVQAGCKLHDSMFSNILQATMKFFNLNSSGRILNRFSKDVGAMDELLPKAMLEAIQIFLIMIGILVMVAIVNHWMIIPMFVIGIFFYLLRIYYLNTAQEIKRLEGVAKSPVFSHVNATLNGLTTIRSSGKNIQEILRKEFDNCQDTHTGAWFLYIATSCSFGLALDLVSCLFITFVCYSFILVDSDGNLGGYVGLAISQSLTLTGMLQYGIKQSAEVQSQMTAIERILQYTNLPKEEQMTTPTPLPDTWPHSGRVELKNVFMKYNSDDPPVLKDLNVTIEAGWKVGVVGRTGAGKSSLIGALFRLTGDGLEGEITIDGIDTSSIFLQTLRSSISIIPQEPVLFSQTLRYNLDPFNNYPDSALWDALHEVELNDVILDQKVAEGGTNFSVGQRQLICLARAILRKNRILVLDEATANVDSRTDALIQKTLRTEFVDCTVISIAHRLNTIIDSDRILVMDEGKAVEYGSPYELLFIKKNGYFAQMVQQTGESMVRSLMNIAASSHRRGNSHNRISAL